MHVEIRVDTPTDAATVCAELARQGMMAVCTSPYENGKTYWLIVITGA